MKLSVIVPAYNLENYIEECLTSVLDQQVNFEYEVIVCNDASTDSTLQKINEISAQYNHLKVINKNKNEGLAAAMLSLLSRCQGEYIAYLDGDDVALPSKLQKQVDYLNNNQDCAMVFHESDMFDSETGETLKLYSQEHYNWHLIPQQSDISYLIRYGTYCQASSVMFRNHKHLQKSVVSECKIILDYPFYIMNAGYLNARIDFIPDILGRYRIHNTSFGAQTSKSLSRRIQSMNDIVAASELGRKFNIDEKIIVQGVEHHIFATALYCLFRNHFDEFYSLISRSTNGERFFNERHKIAWQFRKQPEYAKVLLQS